MRTQSIPVEEFKSNLKKMVDLLATETPILLITPPPFSPDMRQIDVSLRFPAETLELDRDIERTRSFARAVLEVASELNQTSKKGLIATVEVHDSMEAAAIKVGNGDREKGLKHFLSDGLHLSPEGYKVNRQFMSLL
jgi:lysophospholipase L1-like esterase